MFIGTLSQYCAERGDNYFEHIYGVVGSPNLPCIQKYCKDNLAPPRSVKSYDGAGRDCPWMGCYAIYELYEDNTVRLIEHSPDGYVAINNQVSVENENKNPMTEAVKVITYNNLEDIVTSVTLVPAASAAHPDSDGDNHDYDYDYDYDYDSDDDYMRSTEITDLPILTC